MQTPETLTALTVGLLLILLMMMFFRAGGSNSRVSAIRVKVDPYDRQTNRREQEEQDGFSTEAILFTALSIVAGTLLILNLLFR